MDDEMMTNEQDYAFDVAGYLHVPGVLSPPEVEALNRALDEAGGGEGMLGRWGHRSAGALGGHGRRHDGRTVRCHAWART